MKRYFRSILLSLLLILPAVVSAVTPKEMEQARAIAAKSYIRYVNDGSGYLDDINATSVEELQKSLKPKEKENIKVFLAIPAPTDYQGWNKQQLIEYWAGTVFQNKNLVEKGRGGRIMARRLLNKMTVAAPQANAQAQTPQKESPKPTETASTSNEKPVESVKAEENKTAIDSLAAAEALNVEAAIGDDFEEINVQKATNYTWVYIMVLAILVAVVVVLIVMATNVIKKNGAQAAQSTPDHGGMDTEMAEKYQNAISDKDYEIAMLTKKLEAATKQNTELKSKLEALGTEVAALRAASATQKAENVTPTTTGGQRNNSLRTIYLGRANAKQIFVRADRTLNVGNSVFILDTNDGFSGTFRVADSPAAWSLALSNPGEYLAYACVGHDLYDTNGASKIITESAGTAIFEGGCWRVIRKAKIRYE